MAMLGAEEEAHSRRARRGRIRAAVLVFAFNGEPSATNRYLFDGDFVDRGKHGAEVFLRPGATASRRA